VQAFFLARPLRFDYDPEFSEVDFEYLPHGGWGEPATRLYGVSWQTVRLDPWQSFNQASTLPGSFDGWQVLTVRVEATRAALCERPAHRRAHRPQRALAADGDQLQPLAGRRRGGGRAARAASRWTGCCTAGARSARRRCSNGRRP
jgi:hypothetical protein